MIAGTEKLAEFGIKFLGVGMSFTVNGHNLFHNSNMAPILAHLALREMEKKYFIQYSTDRGPMLEIIHRWVFVPMVPEVPIPGGEWQDENTFIAFWTAIQEAVGEK